jgi:NAD(P)-dependent dehydrogenase (short-subunit alcohol dehydrogenase family)
LLDQLDVAQRLTLDVTSDKSITGALREAGDIDAVINNAAINGSGPLENFPIEQLHRIIDTNAVGPLRLLQHVLPAWRERRHGVIVNVSSVSGRVSTPLDAPYSASKYALEAISEALHYELGHFNIRTVIIEPGYIAPGMKSIERDNSNAAYHQLREELNGLDSKVTGPQGRTGPDVVARAIRAAIEDEHTPLRVPVGADAELILATRSQLGDAEFESLMRATIGLTW